MATVTTPSGKIFEETQPVALAYYRREEGYTVDDGAAVLAEDAQTPPEEVAPDPDDVPPHENASLDDWIAYATAHGDSEASTKTRNQLVNEYKAAHSAD